MPDPAKRTRILLIEDSPSDAQLLREMLLEPAQQGALPEFEVKQATLLEEGLKLLLAEHFDLVLLDLELPDGSGIELLDQIFAAGIAAPPIVVLTGLDNEDLATKMVRIGAQDYLVKGKTNGAMLRRTIAYARERHRFIAAERRLQEELSAANTRLQELDRNKDKFVAYLSHEFRNVLGIISNAAQLLSDAKIHLSSEEHVTYCKMISAHVRRLSMMVTNILDHAKIENGKIELSKRPTDLSAMLRGEMPHYQVLAAATDVTVDFAAGRASPVSCDEEWIKQVFLNLVGNAIKHAPKGGRVEIALADLEAGGLRGSVHNQGPDIAAADLERIFHRFEQAPDADTVKRGTGLGLTICREIVEKHGGRIWAESGTGQGATFILELPMKAEAT